MKKTHLCRPRIWTFLIGPLGLALFVAGAAAAPVPLVTERYRVPAVDPGIELYVRNKRPAGQTRFAPGQILLFVHGATYPAETSFDLALDGLSWMDYIGTRLAPSGLSSNGGRLASGPV